MFVLIEKDTNEPLACSKKAKICKEFAKAYHIKKYDMLGDYPIIKKSAEKIWIQELHEYYDIKQIKELYSNSNELHYN